MAMKNLVDEQKKKAIAPDPISAAAGGVQAANATKAALVNQASARPAWAASAANPAPAPQGQQAYQMFAPTTAATNQTLQMQRNEMGTNNTSLTQMASQIDPSIRRDAERAREWRIMSPQQRREEVDRLGMEQDARIAGQASAGTWEDRQKYARSLADPTGMFIDSYGRESPMYSPETAERIRSHQRKIEPAVARMMSSYDRTKWDGPQAYLDAASALPEVIEAGEFGKAIVFNIGRKYASPQIRAQMEADDRNQKLFRQSFTAKAAEEIIQRMAQEGQVSPEYASGYRFTNEGSEEFADQIWLNRNKDPRAGQIVNEIMANAPVMWAEEGGRVVQDPAHQERRRVMLEQRNQQSQMDARNRERDEAIRAEHIRYSGIQRTNPEYAKNMRFNEVTGKYDDFNDFVPEKEETNWGEIYQNNARIAEVEATLSWAIFTNEAQAAEEAARQFPTNPNLPPTDAFNQQALSEQQRAVDVWRTQVNPPEKRAELEREIYNLKLRGQELRKGFKNPPQAADQSEYQQPNGEKNDKPTTYGFLPDVVDNGDPPVIDVDKETDEMLKRLGLSVSSREGQLFALEDALQDTSKTLEENMEQYAYWRSGKGGGFAPGGERRAAFAEKYFNKYAVNGRLPQNIRDEMWAIREKIVKRMNQDRQAQTEVPAESGKKQNRKNYDKAGEYRVGKLPDESIYEQYRSTGRISVASADMDKIPISISVAGKNEYITMVDPNELSSLMKKRNVGPASPVKVRMIPIEDIADVGASENDVERIRNRYGISPFASRKQVLAVAADRINNENKKRVHPFKNMFDWSPDLQWFQA